MIPPEALAIGAAFAVALLIYTALRFQKPLLYYPAAISLSWFALYFQVSIGVNPSANYIRGWVTIPTLTYLVSVAINEFNNRRYP